MVKRIVKKKSKFEWMTVIGHLASTQPEHLREVGDLTLSQMLLNVIVEEQRHVSEDNLATLVGVAATLFGRYQRTMPAPSHVSGDGQRVYTDKDVAAHLGVSVEEVHRMSEELAEALPDEVIFTEVDPSTLNRIN